MEEMQGKVLAIGRAEGRAEGFAEGRSQGRAEGRVKGNAEGRGIGRAEGRTAGRAEGLRIALLKLLAYRGIETSETQRQIIAGCADPRVCARWYEQAFRVSSINDLFR